MPNGVEGQPGHNPKEHDDGIEQKLEYDKQLRGRVDKALGQMPILQDKLHDKYSDKYDKSLQMLKKMLEDENAFFKQRDESRAKRHAISLTLRPSDISQIERVLDIFELFEKDQEVQFEDAQRQIAGINKEKREFAQKQANERGPKQDIDGQIKAAEAEVARLEAMKKARESLAA